MFVPANFNLVFQLLDLVINVIAKSTLKIKFSEWYPKKIVKALDKGQDIR